MPTASCKTIGSSASLALTPIVKFVKSVKGDDSQWWNPGFHNPEDCDIKRGSQCWWLSSGSEDATSLVVKTFDGTHEIDLFMEPTQKWACRVGAG